MPDKFTYLARGDKSSANNPSLNSESTNQVPVTELRFEANSGPDGDVTLETNNGASDPDTTMFVNGVATTFTVELTGTLPDTADYEDVGGLDISGTRVIVVTDDSTGQRYYFLPDVDASEATMAAIKNGAIPLGSVSEDPPPLVICFAAGTLIDMPNGARPVETLVPGDVLMTDAGPRPLRWIGQRRVSAADMVLHAALRAVRIEADALAPGTPDRAVTVSANHRVQVSGWQVQLALGCDRALIAAKHLVNDRRIRWSVPPDGVTFFHLMFDSHRLVTTSNMVSESFEPGPMGLATLSPDARSSVRAILSGNRADDPAHATPTLRRHEARVLQLG